MVLLEWPELGSMRSEWLKRSFAWKFVNVFEISNIKHSCTAGIAIILLNYLTFCCNNYENSHKRNNIGISLRLTSASLYHTIRYIFNLFWLTHDSREIMKMNLI